MDCARNARAWSHCINGGNYHGKKVVFIHRTCIIEMVLQIFFSYLTVARGTGRLGLKMSENRNLDVRSYLLWISNALFYISALDFFVVCLQFLFSCNKVFSLAGQFVLKAKVVDGPIVVVTGTWACQKSAAPFGEWFNLHALLYCWAKVLCLQAIEQ